jgi:hypothetical protein
VGREKQRKPGGVARVKTVVLAVNSEDAHPRSKMLAKELMSTFAPSIMFNVMKGLKDPVL